MWKISSINGVGWTVYTATKPTYVTAVKAPKTKGKIKFGIVLTLVADGTLILIVALSV